ncbi:MAG TPA: hypothetical protein VGI19_13460 [Candidatus Cybelea sp.]
MTGRQGSLRHKLVIVLDGAPCERGVELLLTPADDAETIVAERFRVAITLWRENPTILRGTIAHPSGAVAHFQGGEALITMAEALGLRVVRRPESR